MSASNSADSKPETPLLRRRWARRSLVALGIVATLALLVTIAPRYIARYLLASELDRIGIDYEGVESVGVNLWTGQVRLGPVRFRMGEADPGQLGDLRLNLRYWPLISKRAAVQGMEIGGIELVVNWTADGEILINGIPLDALAPGADATGESARRPDETGNTWGVGFDDLVLTDSRLVLNRPSGGTLTAALDELTLSGFRTWTPQDPGRFDLKSRINEITVRLRGTARPFAERITVEMTSEIGAATLEKVSDFTGPLPLDQNRGSYSASLQHTLTLGEGGRIGGESRGRIELTDIEYAQSGVAALAVGGGSVKVDASYALSPDGGATFDGSASLELADVEAAVGTDTSVGAAALKAELPALSVALSDGGSAVSLSVSPEVDIDGLLVSGPIRISVESVLQVLQTLQALSVGSRIGAATGLEAYADTGAELPSADISADRARLALTSLDLSSSDGVVSLGLAGDQTLEALRVDSGGRQIDVTRLRAAVAGLDLRSGEGELDLDITVDTQLDGGSATSPAGSLEAESLQASVRGFGFAVTAAGIALHGDGSAAGRTLTAQVMETDALPQARIALGELEASLDGASLELGETGITNWQSAGNLVLGALDVSVGADGALGRGALASFEVTGVEAGLDPGIGIDRIVADGLEASLSRSLIQQLLRNEKSGPEAPQSARSGDAIPLDGALVQRLQQALNERGYPAGPADGLIGPQTRAAVEAFQRERGQQADGYIDAALLAGLGVPAAGSTVPGPRLRVGRLALTDGSRIRFSDRQVQPAVDIDTVFEKMAVRNVDTGDPSARAAIDLAMDVNDFTRVTIAGWASGFTATTSLDIEARLTDLPLAPYSPYASEFIGMYLERGRLTTAIGAKADAGLLSGQIDVNIDNLEFETLSEADEARLADSAGMPVRLAASLLEDPQGNIALSLPLEGSVTKPGVDVSSAIRQAVGGALRKIFPPTAIAGMLASGKGSAIDFEPLVFGPGSAQLDNGARSAASDVAELLRARPQLGVDVCGRATSADRALAVASTDASEGPAAATGAAPDEAAAPPGSTGTTPSADSSDGETARAVAADLENLAAERTRAARRFLIEELGIESGRVGECRAVYDAGDTAPPRVEITL